MVIGSGEWSSCSALQSTAITCGRSRKRGLALACEREHQPERARQLLTELVAEFPANPLFAHELALLKHPADEND